MQMPHLLEALTNGDGHRHRLRLAGQLSKLLDELVGLGVLDVKAHALPFYPKHGTRVAHRLGARSGMIEAQDLTKIYGGKAAVDHLSFTVEPGRVTGFLGPNGAGKSTTMRMILGLDRPQSGFAVINGRRYRDLRDPLHTVGALLEAKSVHPGRSARNHLLFLAQTQGIPASRVEEVLALVGLQEVADKRAGGFSLGMSQRLGVAVAMLGNPEILLLDEPVNGLDPEGVLWIRNLMKSLAAEGRT